MIKYLHLSKARLSEVQAIAIYEAEVFWIRKPERRKILIKILDEERSHRDDFTRYGKIPSFSYWLSVLAGYILGTLLSILPWKLMCRIQSWAEEEAARIYDEAAVQLGKDSFNVPNDLIESLIHARDQEREHAKTFKSLATLSA